MTYDINEDPAIKKINKLLERQKKMLESLKKHTKPEVLKQIEEEKKRIKDEDCGC